MADSTPLQTPADRNELLKQWLARSTPAGQHPAIARASRGQALRMSSGQRRLYIQEQVSDVGGDLNVPIAWRLHGPLDAAALFLAIDLVVERHEVLRTSYCERDGDFLQQPHAHSPLPVRLELVTSAELPTAIEDEAYAPFDFAAAPMLRAKLFQLGPQEHVFVVTLPHIAMDGASLAVLVSELEAAYRPGGEGEAAPLPALELQYVDFAEAQHARFASDAFGEKLRFWEERLAGAPMMLPLPTDRPYPARRRYAARWHPFVFAGSLADEVEALARQEKASFFMVLLAAYKMMLSRWTNTTDVVVGSPVSGRGEAVFEPLIGFFVNTLPLRTRVDHGASFRTLLREVRKTVISAIEHQEVPYDVLVRQFAKERSTSVNALIQAEISFNDAQATQLSLRGLRAERHDVVARATRNDLVLAFERGGESLRCDLIYDTELFDHETMARFMAAFDAALGAALRHPDTPLRLLPTDARATPAAANAEAPFDPLRTLYDGVRACAAAAPTRAAVLAADGRIDYAQLLDEVDSLATRLLAAGAGPECAVAAHMGRSAWLVVSLLASWKIGAAWVPMDTGNSDARIEAILAAVRPEIILRLTPAATSRHLTTGLELTCAAAFAEPRNAADKHPDALAYVVFTSGTTGQPKGVGITYRNVAHLIDAVAPLAAAQGSISPNVLAPSFDGWLWSTILPLAYGSGVAIVDPLEIGEDLLAAQGAVVTITPTLLATVSEAGAHPATVIVAGEAAPDALIERWRQRARFVNAYGPTETTICATWADTARGDDPSTIGRDIARCRTYVLDEALQPVADGMPGELFIGGAGVGRGYLGMSGATAARFLPDPAGAGVRMYRSGDVVRRRQDGSLEFLGRKDAQLKIRGFRIEPGAIECVAARVDGIVSAVAFAVPGVGGQVLGLAVAFGAPAQEGEVRVRAALAESLPDFMQPTHLLVLDDMPRTLAGKVDIQALRDRISDAIPQTAPARGFSPTEELVARVWSEMLGVPVTQADRSFFDLGGHSLLASRVVSALRKQTGMKLSIRDMLSKPTIAASAEAIDRLRALAEAT